MPIGRATTTSSAVGGAELARQLLGSQFGVLVDVAGIERRILVRRRILDVPVHAAGAAMHDALDVRGFGRLENIPRAFDIDRAIRRVRLPRLAIRRGDVVHDIDAVDRAAHRRGIHQVAVARRHAAAGNGERSKRSRLRERTSARTSSP